MSAVTELEAVPTKSEFRDLDAVNDALENALGLQVLLEPRELTRKLNAVFGPATTGKLAGYDDPKIAYRWSRQNGPKPAREALRRLYASYRIFLEVSKERSLNQTAAWFLAPHPALHDQQPLELMTQGRFAEVSGATPRNSDSPARQLKTAQSDIHEVSALWHERSLDPLVTVIRSLAERFGAPTVATLAGQSNTKAAYRWVKNEGKLPSGEAARRIYGFYRATTALDDVFVSRTARAWFLAANRSLDERSPLEVARDGNLHEFLSAADQLLFALNNVRNKK